MTYIVSGGALNSTHSLPVSIDPHRPGVGRPVKSHSYWRSGRTDSIHHCQCKCQPTVVHGLDPSTIGLDWIGLKAGTNFVNWIGPETHF